MWLSLYRWRIGICPQPTLVPRRVGYLRLLIDVLHAVFCGFAILRPAAVSDLP
jgi:hypothetical protein